MDKSRLGFLEYLAQTRDDLKRIREFDSVKLVVGNEACDLDSAVCSLVLAYHLSKSLKSPEETVIPVLNIHRQDYALKTEVCFVLQSQGIEERDLVFTDAIDLNALSAESKLALVLVDHNYPVSVFAPFASDVELIVDHHSSDPKSNTMRNVEKVIELVGSCATLVAEILLKSAQNGALSSVTSYLLYQTIILDTCNFSTSARKATPKDCEIAEKLAKTISVVSTKEQIYSSLVDAKSDVSGLNIQQLLRKDLKILELHSLRIAVSSVPVLVKGRIIAEDSLREVECFCELGNYNACVVLGVQLTAQIERDLLVYASDSSLLSIISDGLSESKDVDLQLHDSSRLLPGPKHYRYLSQGNCMISRKQILPLLRRIVEESYASDVDSLRSEIGLMNDIKPTATPHNSYADFRIHDNVPHNRPDALKAPLTPPNSYVDSAHRTPLSSVDLDSVIPRLNLRKDSQSFLGHKSPSHIAVSSDIGSLIERGTYHNSRVYVGSPDQSAVERHKKKSLNEEEALFQMDDEPHNSNGSR